MKRSLWLTLILVCVAASLLAQDQPTEYLFGRGGKVRVGGFGGTITDFSTVGNDLAVFNGGGGAVIFNRRLFIGGFGQSLVTNHNRLVADVNNSITNSRLELAYGGLWVGYNFWPHSIVHGTISTKIGGGAAAWLPQNNFNFNNQLYRTGVFVAIPTLGVEINIFRFMKVGVEGGYRIMNGLPADFPFYTNQTLSGPTGSLTLRFGWFGEPRRND